MAPSKEIHVPERKDVEKAFEQFGQLRQLVHAALRPLPVQTGDGTDIQTVKTTGLLKDATTAHLSDVETLLETLKDKVTGELVNDKTYLMERIIQVGISSNSVDRHLFGPASSYFTCSHLSE